MISYVHLFPLKKSNSKIKYLADLSQISTSYRGRYRHLRRFFWFIRFELFVGPAFVIYKTLWQFSTVRCRDFSICKHLAFTIAAVSIRGMQIIEVLSYGSLISQNVLIAIVTTNVRLPKSLVDGIRDDAILAFLLILDVLVARCILRIGWHLASTSKIDQRNIKKFCLQYLKCTALDKKFGVIKRFLEKFPSTSLKF